MAIEGKKSSAETSRLDPAQRTLLSILWLGMFLVSFDFAAISIALPSISEQLNSGFSSTSWVSLAYLLMMAGMLLPAGRLTEVLDHRRILVAGFMVFGLASLGCALSRDIFVLSGFRVIQGVGA